jgi:hypothetical protein
MLEALAAGTVRGFRVAKSEAEKLDQMDQHERRGHMLHTRRF